MMKPEPFLSLMSTNIALKLTLLLYFLNLVAVRLVLSADNYTRHDFPADFVFGSGTSAYQWEGAVDEDGRTPSIWDTYAHAGFVHGDNGDIACDGYHKYKEDVKLMVETGLEAYRLSISWSRLIPNGRGPINPKGLQFYNNLINELVSNGIQPHVTLHNFDLPQALEDEYGGWVSPKIIQDFTNYADVCFREFGDRVLYWNTVNEPNVFTIGGYDEGTTPPLRCSPPFCKTYNSSRGDSTTEPYLAVHHILLSHSSAVKLYRRKYKDKQHGFIGIAVYSFGFIPANDTDEDRAATQRAHEFFIGWILEPLVYGDYPISMKTNAGARIPTFSDRESEQLKGSCDFIGVIFYNNINVTDNSIALRRNLRDFDTDMAAQLIFGQALFSNEEYPVTPWALREELNIMKTLYGNPPIFIYENGQRTQRSSSLQDVSRVEYLHGYIGAVLDSLRDGSNIKGYFAWSFMDVFELLDGYNASFGLYYVDRDDPELTRYPKLSAEWYGSFLKGGKTSVVGAIKLEKDQSLVSIGHLYQ
ncbi:glycosyl hydrolase 1 [Stylosanthes scabra]|uniref:Glycosyl hydrolase 1 n=1 Tax=Stylosanthes scabra TaxID=79078 RepID=A0ABU6U5T8_9FABA|nr:glycosyl hydrolase 1 [Stylosanthes scabra]